jgi:antitoxin PrlF
MILGTSSITSKGQITLPKAVRESLGVETGQKVEILLEDGVATVRPYGATEEQLLGSLAAYAVGKPSDKAAVATSVNTAKERRYQRKLHS